MVGLCVYVDGDVVRLSVRAMLAFCKVKGDVEIICNLLISLSFATESMCLEYSADLLPYILCCIR